jgi:hypothetical protein
MIAQLRLSLEKSRPQLMQLRTEDRAASSDVNGPGG